MARQVDHLLAQAAQKAVELGGKYSCGEVPDELNPHHQKFRRHDRRLGTDRRC